VPGAAELSVINRGGKKQEGVFTELDHQPLDELETRQQEAVFELQQLPPLLLLEWQEGVWRRALPVHWQAPRPGAMFGLPLLAAAAALLLFRRRIKTLLAALHEQIGHLHSDNQVHTPTAIALNALLALPGPLVLAGLGLVLVSGGQGVAVGFGKACSHLAMVVLLSGLAAMGILQAKLILAHGPFFGVNLFRLIFGLALATVPLVLAGLIVAGYEYTALTLVGHFAVTLYLLGVWILAEATVKRGLAVAARRLAFRRAQARHHVEEQEGAEGGLDRIEEPPLDLQQINQQSLRFTKLMLFLPDPGAIDVFAIFA
jgi:potassium-dependent mechanosensitive channel